jgi:hypothetical protein
MDEAIAADLARDRQLDLLEAERKEWAQRRGFRFEGDPETPAK